MAMNGKLWSERDIEILRKLYPHRSTAAIARRLRCSPHRVYAKAAHLRLEKTKEYLDSPEACRLRRGDDIGAAFRFAKGHVPANEGLRRPGWYRGRMRETQFKKGVRTGIAAKLWKPIGTILADREGYLRIKVRERTSYAEEPGWHPNVWPLLSHHVWQQHHGPIPNGHLVVFKDRDRSNCVIENLELITLAENMRRNSVHKLPPELKQVIQLNGVLKRQIRRLNGKEQDVGLTRSSVRNAGGPERSRQADGSGQSTCGL
jgi:HNH endonuclease